MSDVTIPETKIEYLRLEHIKPYERNAKKHPKKHIDQIAASIHEFGFLVPVVIDQNGELVAGHGRHLAAQKLGLETIPAVCAEHLNEEQIKAYRLADNKLNESDWDMKLVVEELRELSLPMLDLTGFSRDLLLKDEDKDDNVPSAPKTPRTKMGDVYELGKHRIVCGDSTKPETYAKLMRGNSADMVFTDPPYNVNYSGRGEKTKHQKIENDALAKPAFGEFLHGFFQSAVTVVKAGAGWYIFHSSSSQDQFRIALEEAGLAVRAQLIWNKPTASMGWGDYRWKHEPFFYAGREGQKITFYGDRSNKTVIDFHDDEKKLIAWVKREKLAEKEGRATIWSIGRDNVNNYEHPTQKPVELMSYAIVNSSKADDIVLDPFMGSGSTLIAAEKTERIAYGIELDPVYTDVIIQRWVDYTGITDVVKNGEVETWEISTNVVALSGEANAGAEGGAEDDSSSDAPAGPLPE